MSRNKGFTLIELMIVIAIFGVLSAIITPSFLSWRDRSMVRGDATELRAVFESAKLRAIKHNTNAVVTFPDTNSYQAFVDPNDNGVRDVDEDLIVTRTLSPGVTMTTITFVGNDMAFNSRGMANGPNSTGRVVLTSPGGISYEVVVSSFGRVRLDRL
jgi:prepilin-type N-terminal cleavage/methylation domain-containing protein